MRKDPIDQGRLTEHSRGLGTVTRDMVARRAREIAMVNGRGAKEVTQADFAQARRELTGRGDMTEEPEAPRKRAHAELRETIRGTRGRKAKSTAAHDEQTDSEQLVEEGVAEAEHDQMVEGTKRSLRRERTG